MNKDLSDLRDPITGCALMLSEKGLTNAEGQTYGIVNGIPRFVDVNNYSDDFGLQWNIFYKTQLDSQAGINLSENRVERCLRGELAKINGKKVLEAGSGAGRFTEIFLKHGANLHSFDYSSAVEANARNNGDSDNLTLVQADIRNMPFPKNSYDIVICFGVLQHTPSTEESIRHLWEMVKPGGVLAIDHYPLGWRKIVSIIFGPARPLLRQVLLRLPRKHRFRIVKALTDFWFPVHWKFKEYYLIQKILHFFSPMVFHFPGIYLPSRDAYYEWALLDTHDCTTDAFRRYRTVASITKTLEELTAVDIHVTYGLNGIEAFCRKAPETNVSVR
jgi:SAM-dependent methyltransferase